MRLVLWSWRGWARKTEPWAQKEVQNRVASPTDTLGSVETRSGENPEHALSAALQAHAMSRPNVSGPVTRSPSGAGTGPGPSLAPAGEPSWQGILGVLLFALVLGLVAGAVAGALTLL